MIPQGTDMWVKAGVAFVAIDFILSLPSWALGLVLVIALATRYGTQQLREKERREENPGLSSDERSDAR